MDKIYCALLLVCSDPGEKASSARGYENMVRICSNFSCLPLI